MKEILKLDHIQKYYGNGGNVTKAIQDITSAENGLVQETTFLTREQRLKLPIGKISHRKQELNSNQ